MAAATVAVSSCAPLMQFRPCLNHVLLTFGQAAGDQFDGINSLNRDFILIIGMKVRRAVLNAGFHVHPNDDSEKSAQFGHGGSLLMRPDSFTHWRLRHHQQTAGDDGAGAVFGSLGSLYFQGARAVILLRF